MTQLSEIVTGNVPGAGRASEGGHVLTPRQRRILRAIRDSIRIRGYPPSIPEIGASVGLASTSSVDYQLGVLERAGYLKRDVGLRRRRPRVMELRMPASVPPPVVPGHSGPARAPVLVPVVAGVQEGLPVLDAGQIEDVWPLPRQVTGDGTLFMVRVAGEAMVGAAIAPWDWVVVRQAGDAADGDIVLATLAGDAAVRTLRRRGGHTWLVPHHPDYQPVLADDATILGVITAVLRLV